MTSSEIELSVCEYIKKMVFLKKQTSRHDDDC